MGKKLTIESPMKVLLSCLFFKNYTGSEMYVYELAKGLKKLNCDVTVLSDINGKLSEDAKKYGIKVLPLHTPPGYKLGDGKWKMKTPKGFITSQPNQFYKQSNVTFDIIHTQHTPITNLICTLYPNTPKISTIHSEVISLENPILHSSIRKYICIRPEIQEHIEKNFNIDKSKSIVIYNPIDTERFNTENTKDDGYILFVGTVDYLRKNTLFDLVDYSKKENKELWIVGANHADYINTLTQHPHVKYYDATNKVENFVKNCSETAGILLGRTTIEGWLCGKPGWIYNVDDSGNILNKQKHEVPEDVSKFDSLEIAKKIKEEYIKILE